MGLLLLVLLILILLGVFPREGAYSADFGRGPVGLLVTIILILVILMLCGVIPHRGFDL